MSALPLSLRLALRELRGGLRGFYVFLACIALGVGSIAGINSVSRALTDGIASQGRVILGGDVAFSLIHRPANPDELAFLQGAGRVGTIATMRAMVRSEAADGQSLVELKAVDAAYPHGGTLALDPPGDAQSLLAESSGRYGALAAPELLDRLGIETGAAIRLGSLTLEVRGTIRSEPDRLSSGIGFGPRLIVSLDALQAAGLLQEGSLVTWVYRVALPDQAGPAAIARLQAEAEAAFPEAGWGMRSRDNAAPGLNHNIDRFSQFLTLVGLTALIVGGVGVANAVASFVDIKRPSIATYKCLGAGGGLVFRIYLLQILILATLGIAIGLGLGALMPLIAKLALADLVPVAGGSLYPREMVLASLYGFLVATAFALGPLGRARQMPAVTLFADRAIGSPIRPPAAYLAIQAALLVALAALAVLLSHDRRLALTYVGGVIAAFLVLRVVGIAVMAGARRIRNLRGTVPRLAVRNIHRPGALTPSVVLSLGLGLTLLVSLALIDLSLRSQLTGAIVERAPDFYFLDIQNAESDRFIAEVESLAPGGTLRTVPMLRGRFVAVKDRPAAAIDGDGSSWALRGDRGITYSATLPENSRITEGEWWQAGYQGQPLVSMEAEIARDLGLSLGDTITVNVLGRNVTARVANLRTVDWESLSINFVMVFSPNTFEAAPHAYMATLRLADDAPPQSERRIVAGITDSFPGVTTISVRDAIASINELIADLALASRIAASLALVVSMLVLGGALAAGHRQRQQDAVVLKALGATRRQLLGAFALEYGLLGLATAIFGLLAGMGAAWYVVTEVMDISFAFSPTVGAMAAGAALAVTLGIGLAGTWRILSVRPAPYLRNL